MGGHRSGEHSPSTKLGSSSAFPLPRPMRPRQAVPGCGSNSLQTRHLAICTRCPKRTPVSHGGGPTILTIRGDSTYSDSRAGAIGGATEHPKELDTFRWAGRRTQASKLLSNVSESTPRSVFVRRIRGSFLYTPATVARNLPRTFESTFDFQSSFAVARPTERPPAKATSSFADRCEANAPGSDVRAMLEQLRCFSPEAGAAESDSVSDVRAVRRQLRRWEHPQTSVWKLDAV